jgi:hypothetical protein
MSIAPNSALLQALGQIQIPRPTPARAAPSAAQPALKAATRADNGNSTAGPAAPRTKAMRGSLVNILV